MAQARGTGRRWTFRSTPQRKMMFGLGMVVALLGALFATMAPGASAATSATAITDYATYPQAGLIPADCLAAVPGGGPGVLKGLNYKIEREGFPDVNTADITHQQLVAGDKVTMTWTDYTPGCEGLAVSLAVKETPHNTFVLTDNQTLYDFTYCSGTDCGSGNAFGGLSITIPTPPHLCNFQFDAIIGPPLAVIGPNGSYYNNSTRKDGGKPNPDGPNMLIGASNGGKGTCAKPTAEAHQSCTSQVDLSDTTAAVESDAVNALAAGTPSVTVDVTNPDVNDARSVDILKDGVVVFDNVNVPVGATVSRDVSFAVNETATVKVVDSVWGEIFSQEYTFDCVHPHATFAHSCSADTSGETVTFTNLGENAESSAIFTVTKNGSVIDTVTVAAGGTETRTYAMNEDETSTFRVTSTDFDSGNQSVTHDCVQVEATTTTIGTTTTTVPDTVKGLELARTGANSTSSFTMLSGALLLLGGILMALANRPLPNAATSSSRGR